MSTLKYFFVRLYFFLVSLSSFGQSVELQEVGIMPSVLPECSGFAVIGDNAIATINDSGNDPKIFILDSLGIIKSHTSLLGFTNHDWESLAYADGLLYIGDFGNNANKRRNLKIYIVDISKLLSEDLWAFKGEITFNFPEQKAFPPADSAKHFDLEAMVVHHDSIFLFTKNRSKPFSGISNCYSLSTKPGSYSAKKKGQIFTGLGLMPAYWVTGACLSEGENPDLYLLGYDKIWRIRDYFGQKENYLEAEALYQGSFGQRESICILNNKFYIGEEQIANNKAKIYKAPVPALPEKEADIIIESLSLEKKIFGSTLELTVPDKNLQGQLYFEIYNQGGDLLLKGRSEDCKIKGDKIIIDTKSLGLGSYILNTVLAGKPRAYLVKKTLH